MCSDVSLFIKAEASPNLGDSRSSSELHFHDIKLRYRNKENMMTMLKGSAVSPAYTPMFWYWCLASGSLTGEVLVDIAALLVPSDVRRDKMGE